MGKMVIAVVGQECGPPSIFLELHAESLDLHVRLHVMLSTPQSFFFAYVFQSLTDCCQTFMSQHRHFILCTSVAFFVIKLVFGVCNLRSRRPQWDLPWEWTCFDRCLVRKELILPRSRRPISKRIATDSGCRKGDGKTDPDYDHCKLDWDGSHTTARLEYSGFTNHVVSGRLTLHTPSAWNGRQYGTDIFDEEEKEKITLTVALDVF